MLHSRGNNNRIKYLHEKCSRLTLRKKPKFHLISWCGNFVETSLWNFIILCSFKKFNKTSYYERLLEKDGSVSIHHKIICTWK